MRKLRDLTLGQVVLFFGLVLLTFLRGQDALGGVIALLVGAALIVCERFEAADADDRSVLRRSHELAADLERQRTAGIVKTHEELNVRVAALEAKVSGAALGGALGRRG